MLSSLVYDVHDVQSYRQGYVYTHCDNRAICNNSTVIVAVLTQSRCISARAEMYLLYVCFLVSSMMYIKATARAMCTHTVDNNAVYYNNSTYCNSVDTSQVHLCKGRDAPVVCFLVLSMMYIKATARATCTHTVITGQYIIIALLL